MYTPLDLYKHSISSIGEAEALILSLVHANPRPYQSRAGADPQYQVHRLLGQLGDPHLDLPCVHIAGSKGKGSVALFLESILRATGLRVGTFTSPHLERWAERIRIDGEPVADTAFVRAIESVRLPLAQLLADNPENGPAFFDVLTAAALGLLREQGVDYAVIETGLGGRLDATRVVDARVCCITSIELEHTDKLGTTLGSVAFEKAGIIRSEVPLVCGRLPAEAEAVVSAHAWSQSAPRFRIGKEITVQSTPTNEFEQLVQAEFYATRLEFPMPVPGLAMADNAAMAAVCALLVGQQDGIEVNHHIEKSLARTRLPGRLELLSQRPWVVIDAAHTAASSRALAESLARLPAKRRHFVLSLSGNRDLEEILAPLVELASEVTLTKADLHRSLGIEQLQSVVARLQPKLPIRLEADPRAAVGQALLSLTSDHLLCICGSVYMAGIARALVSER
jgi:dihydrofolate synthase/folylpolyglutamate synthase